LSVVGRILDGMEVSVEAVAKVPGENLRVPRADFGALWAVAERLGERPATGDKYLVGVVFTCRWLARQPVWSTIINQWEIPAAPLTRRWHSAMPETIDEEYLAAAATAPEFERERARGVMATLEWTWHGSGRPPLDMSTAAAG
jgi:hypothetical protein